MNDILQEFQPSRFFNYSVPNDVVSIPVMYAYENIITRYQINLTDHAFWLGAGCIDKCIEFRNYGASITKEYRLIDTEKISIVPFYPIVHREREFLGYPFEKKADQKIVFSGGALYKTLGGGNRYYKIVEHVLNNHKDVIFWYAGDGDDSELRKLFAKFPGRIYHTAERSDLFQVLEHCDVYLSTYPMCGGLMFMYAAMAGRVPVTLKNSSISNDFLINQNNINVEFDNPDSLYNEMDKLLSDNIYAADRSELMKKSVISPEIFETEIYKLIDQKKSDSFVPTFDHLDTAVFRNWYLEVLNSSDIDEMFADRRCIKQTIALYPFRVLKGGMHKLQRRLLPGKSKNN